jgi:hypothetical protein
MPVLCACHLVERGAEPSLLVAWIEYCVVFEGKLQNQKASGLLVWCAHARTQTSFNRPVPRYYFYVVVPGMRQRAKKPCLNRPLKKDFSQALSSENDDQKSEGVSKIQEQYIHVVPGFMCFSRRDA